MSRPHRLRGEGYGASGSSGRGELGERGGGGGGVVQGKGVCLVALRGRVCVVATEH